MTTAIPIPPTVDAPQGSRARAQQDFEHGLREIQNSAPPIEKLRPYIRPLRVKVRLGVARIWKNKGLYTGMACFVTAAVELGGSATGFIVGGVCAIVAEVLT